MPELSLENTEVFLKALTLYTNSSTGFVDCLITCLAAQAGCSHTVTFDRKAGKLPGMVRIS
jgi:predicted nucleic-acid-binding protein